MKARNFAELRNTLGRHVRKEKLVQCPACKASLERMSAEEQEHAFAQ